jgi:hypothetical protein
MQDAAPISPTIRVLQLGASASVVTLAGDLDATAGALLAAALARTNGRALIVDLLSARNVDAPVQDVILASAHGTDVTVVADPQLLQVFEVRATALLGLATSLADAVAGRG